MTASEVEAKKQNHMRGHRSDNIQLLTKEFIGKSLKVQRYDIHATRFEQVFFQLVLLRWSGLQTDFDFYLNQFCCLVTVKIFEADLHGHLVCFYYLLLYSYLT